MTKRKSGKPKVKSPRRRIVDAGDCLPKLPVSYGRTIFRRKDRKREARRDLLQVLLKKLRPPSEKSLKGRSIGRFRKWCEARGLNPDRETTGGKHFQRFREDLQKEFESASARLGEIADLLKMTSPVPIDFETTQDHLRVIGWNQCLFDYVKSGRVSERHQNNEALLEGWVAGFNAACQALAERTKK